MRFWRTFLLCLIVSISCFSMLFVGKIFAAPGTSSMVGYWKLDESTQGSNAADSSGYGNTGSPHGTGSGPSTSTDVTYTTFPDSHSASFNGTDQYIEEQTIVVWIQQARLLFPHG